MQLDGTCRKDDTTRRMNRWPNCDTSLYKQLVTFIVCSNVGIEYSSLLNIFSSDIHTLLEAEKSIHVGKNRFLELFIVPRNRRATLASFIVMFM